MLRYLYRQVLLLSLCFLRAVVGGATVAYNWVTGLQDLMYV